MKLFPGHAFVLRTDGEVWVEFSGGEERNVRRAIVNCVTSLSDAMLLADNDNTQAYESISNILWSVLSLHSIRRIDLNRRFKALCKLEQYLKSTLFGQHWKVCDKQTRGHNQKINCQLKFIYIYL